MEKEKLVVIIGPTAVGKTRLSIELAKKFNGEVISGDSMQVYKGMDIGTAKATKAEMDGIPHHLLDWKEPENPFNVYDFKQTVQETITDITERGKLPILVGGTGLYIQSVLYDYQFPDTSANQDIRFKLEKQAADEGGEFLYQSLVEIDPVAAEKIHPNNIKRVIRALEVYYSSGTKFSEMEMSNERTLKYEAAVIGLTMERELLYSRINKRVDVMMEAGLEQEVRFFYEKGLKDAQSMQAIGYKEFIDYFESNKTLDEVVQDIKQNSRRFAKRQFTWFRNKMEVDWFDMTDLTSFEKKIEEISAHVAGLLHLKANR